MIDEQSCINIDGEKCQISNPPDLTFIWNRAAQLVRENKISIYKMNEIWGALRILEKYGICKLADSTYN